MKKTLKAKGKKKIFDLAIMVEKLRAYWIKILFPICKIF